MATKKRAGVIIPAKIIDALESADRLTINCADSTWLVGLVTRNAGFSAVERTLELALHALARKLPLRADGKPRKPRVLKPKSAHERLLRGKNIV